MSWDFNFSSFVNVFMWQDWVWPIWTQPIYHLIHFEFVKYAKLVWCLNYICIFKHVKIFECFKWQGFGLPLYMLQAYLIYTPDISVYYLIDPYSSNNKYMSKERGFQPFFKVSTFSKGRKKVTTRDTFDVFFYLVEHIPYFRVSIFFMVLY